MFLKVLLQIVRQHRRLVADLQRDLCILMVLSRNIRRRNFNKCCRKRQMKQKWNFFLLSKCMLWTLGTVKQGFGEAWSLRIWGFFENRMFYGLIEHSQWKITRLWKLLNGWISKFRPWSESFADFTKAWLTFRLTGLSLVGGLS